MKINEVTGLSIDLISEMLMVKPGEMRTDDRERTVSEQTLRREYKKISSLEFPSIGSGSIDIYLSKNEDRALGVDADMIQTPHKVRHAQIFRVSFKKPMFKHPQAMQNILQVTWVATKVAYRSLGIASAVYYELARLGYTVVSDYTQYERAVNLWKRISEEHGTYILDVNSGKLLGTEGAPIRYDGHNIPDSEIWKPAPDTGGMNRLLVLVLSDN